jgi:deoxycytidylate deaminase
MIDNQYRQYVEGHNAEVCLAQAFVLATLSKALRRKTGALVVELRDSVPYIIGSGCNGTQAGADNKCESDDLSMTLPSVIHAEINALRDLPHKKGFRILYCTDSPCEHCLAEIVNIDNGIDLVVYGRKYRIEDHLINSKVPCIHFERTDAILARYESARSCYGQVIATTEPLVHLEK